MMCGMVSMCADHFMKYPGAYPNWQNDLRNMLSLVWNRNCAAPDSCGDVYSGAWAFPESSVCCGTSLSYNQYTAGPTLLRYGALAHSEWASEIGRRMMLMATYDSLPNGVVKDGLFGDQVATAEWSNLAHPWPLCQVLEAIAWLPEKFAPTAKITSSVPLPSCRKFSMKKAKSLTPPSIRRRVFRKSCDWPFVRRRFRPMAAGSRNAPLWTPRAILSLRCRTATGLSPCVTMAADTFR